MQYDFEQMISFIFLWSSVTTEVSLLSTVSSLFGWPVIIQLLMALARQQEAPGSICGHLPFLFVHVISSLWFKCIFFSTAALECVIGCCRRALSIWCEIWAGIFIWVFSIIQYCVRKSSCGWVTEISLIDVFIPPYIRHVTHPPHTRLATKLNHLYIRENWENALFMKSNLSRTLWQTTKII